MEGRFGMVVVCEAVSDPQIQAGTPPNPVTQQLRLIKVLAGKAPEGKVGKTVEFSYYLWAGERAIQKGERAIWFAQEPNEDEWELTKALADTPENRNSVAAKTAAENP